MSYASVPVPGDTPLSGSAGDGTRTQCNPARDLHWREPPNQVGMAMKTDDVGTVSYATGYLHDHLQQNHPDPSNSGRRYKNVIENPQRRAAGAFFSGAVRTWTS